MGAFAKLLNGFGTPTTYIVITYYNVKQKDLNLLDNFQTGMNNSAAPAAKFLLYRIQEQTAENQGISITGS